MESRTLLSSVPVGPEFRVNTYTTGSQNNQSIAMDVDGNFVITWESLGQEGPNSEIYAQRFNAAGVALGPESRVNSFTSGYQSHPSVAMDADGDFVITWEEQAPERSATVSIYAQRFNAAGVPQGSEFRVDTYTRGHRGSPSIAMNADGDFVITWESSAQEVLIPSTNGVFARRFNADGVPQGPEFLVNTYTTDDQVAPAIAMDADGDFVITWSSGPRFPNVGQDGAGSGIYAQRYDAAGVALGTEFLVNSYTTNSQFASSIAMDDDGDFVIAWQSNGQDGSNYGIYAQRYNALGQAQGSEFLVNTYYSSHQWTPSVSMDADGDFVIAWTSVGQDGAEQGISNQGVYAQFYNKSGVPQGLEFLVNSYTTNSQAIPSIAMGDNGNFVIGWSSRDQIGNVDEVYAQRFLTDQKDNKDTIAAWRSSRFYLDSNHSSTWNGSTTDTLNTFGASTDKPLAGDWNGDGYTDIAVWRNGTFYLDANGNGLWDGPATDKTFKFGLNTDTPLVGDWNGDGKDDIGVWRAGKFYLDLDGNRIWNSAIDKAFTFGAATDTPLIGDWNADGKDDLGIWRAGKFYLDLNANRAWNSGVDGIFTFGLNTDTPLIGDWNADGTDDIGVWRAGKFYRDTNGNRAWSSATDTVTTFGSSTDTPLIGYWRPKSIPGSPPAASPPPVTAAIVTATSPATSATTTQVPNTSILATLISPPPKRRDLTI